MPPQMTSLLVLNYLIKNGSERVVTSAREHIYDLRSLENYTFIDESGKDQGVNIRQKVKDLIDFIQDDDRLREERKKAKKNKDKFVGMSSDMVGMKLGSGPEQWDDQPYNRGRGQNDYNDQDWDGNNSANQYKDQTYDNDDQYSDGEGSPRVRRTHLNSSKIKEEIRPGSPTPPVPATFEKRVNISVNTNINYSPKKVVKPLKKVDLGAAATFGQDLVIKPPSIPSSPTECISDDFNPRAGEKCSRGTNKFSHFDAEFVDISAPSQSDFADFSSAFSSTSSTAPIVLRSSTPSTVPCVISPRNMSAKKQNFLEEVSVSKSNMFGGNLVGGVPNVEVGTDQLKTNGVDDLLGDLNDFGSLNIQPGNNGNNNNNVNSVVGGANLLGYLEDTGQPQQISMQRQSKYLEDLASNTIEEFNKIGKVSSQNDVDKILQIIENLLEHIPDYENEISVDFAHYGFLNAIEKLVPLFSYSFPFVEGKPYETVTKLLTVQNPKYFEVILQVLLDSSKKIYHLEAITNCLKVMLQSEALSTNIALCCTSKHSPESWNTIVRLLTSVPNRVSNLLEGSSVNFFSNTIYSKFLLLKYLEVVEVLSVAVFKKSVFKEFINYKYLGLLLSKIVVNVTGISYCDTGLNVFVEIIALLTNQKSEKMRLYKEMFQQVFECLDQTASDILAKLFLTQVDPKKYVMKEILGKNLAAVPTWKYALCKKIPMLTYIDKNQENLVTNLVLYLGYTSGKSLFILLLNLLNVWSDRFALNRTSVEQQLLISKYIVCIINCIKSIKLTDHQRKQLKDKLFEGLPTHLECSVDVLRYLGLKVGEIALNFLYREGDEYMENNLTFEYDKCDSQCKTALNKLQYFVELDFKELYKVKMEFSVSVNELLSKLSNKGEIVIEYIPPKRKFKSKTNKIEQHNEVVVSELVKSKNLGIKIIDCSFELDSDDDFEPFNISNDLPVSKKTPPVYLRDIKEQLLETQDVDVFVLSLENCKKIVTEQLADDDWSIGLELLEILISLDKKMYVENFENLIFQSCVAITCVYPVIYAEYLAGEIHSQIGKYSILHRILMLNILKQVAKTLSSLAPKIQEYEIPEKKKSKLKIKVENDSEIIRKRLESKTQYYHRFKCTKYVKENKFSEVAEYFFFPLVYGFHKNKILTQPLIKDQDDHLLLIHFIETLAVVMFASKNCVAAPRMAKEALQFSWFIRFHKDVKVIMAVLNLIAAAVINVAQSVLLRYFLSELLEIRIWLGDMLSPNVNRGEPNLECRHLAGCVLAIIENVLKFDQDKEEDF